MFTRFTSRAAARVHVTKREGKAPVIEGYAAVFYSLADPGSEYQLWDDFYERIMPGAFNRALQEKHDARGLYNHNRDHLLGRISAGTLRLSVDSKGLKYEIDAPDTQVGRDVVTSLERGDLDGSSFAFIPKRTLWIEEGDKLIRQIEDLDLFDVGPVTYPAYESTTSNVRSAERSELMKELQEWRKSRPNDADIVGMKLRQISLDDDDSLVIV